MSMQITLRYFALIVFALSIIGCADLEKERTDAVDKFVQELETRGLLTACGSTATECGNPPCPDGQYCKETTNKWCFCVRDEESSKVAEYSDSLQAVLIGSSVVPNLPDVDSSCGCEHNGTVYAPGDIVCIGGTVNRCIYDPPSESCMWYNWGVECDLTTFADLMRVDLASQKSIINQRYPNSAESNTFKIVKGGISVVHQSFSNNGVIHNTALYNTGTRQTFYFSPGFHALPAGTYRHTMQTTVRSDKFYHLQSIVTYQETR